MENRTVIGTCSFCGGPVSCPSAWWSIIPPVPTCESCGAVAAQHGPVIPMMPTQQWPIVKPYHITTTDCTNLVEWNITISPETGHI